MRRFIEDTAIWLLEATFAALPGPKPSATQLDAATIVAHRGERDGVRVKENTIAAFEPALAAGVGAIEFDVRYTRDDEPVVIHDADLKRVFGRNERIDTLRWSELKTVVPEIPHAADLFERYAQRTHLMLELKTRGSDRAERRLRDLLAPLAPGRDFHLLSLLPALFEALPDMPATALIPVGKTNWPAIRDWSHRHDCGGAAGPFLFVGRKDIAHARRTDTLLGSGFINRRGLLHREIGRGIPWLFTNRPVALQRMLDDARRAAR